MYESQINFCEFYALLNRDLLLTKEFANLTVYLSIVDLIPRDELN